MRKNGVLSDFEFCMIVGARWATLSILETADLMEFLHTTISRVYKGWSEEEKISCDQQFSEQKCIVNAKDQRRMARLVRAD
ncbi:hypothetical protein Q5P01_005009 [Channa striata]|uniref:Uncharacterized protein n=1 Tax=Channa striata TaxID=64152 RepID=A0AA88NC48_CHASR|nr:hypothetical protein Q5P01_005009 [Channa striata]